MTAFFVLLGALLGVVAGVGTLALTHRRARWVTAGQSARALITYPLVLLVPAALLLLAAWLAPAAAWGAAVALVVTRAVALPRWRASA